MTTWCLPDLLIKGLLNSPLPLHITLCRCVLGQTSVGAHSGEAKFFIVYMCSRLSSWLNRLDQLQQSAAIFSCKKINELMLKTDCAFCTSACWMQSLFHVVFHFQLTRNQSIICSLSMAFWQVRWLRSISSTTMDDSTSVLICQQLEAKTSSQRCHVCCDPDVWQETQYCCPNCPHIQNVSYCITRSYKIGLQQRLAFSLCNSVEAYVQYVQYVCTVWNVADFFNVSVDCIGGQNFMRNCTTLWTIMQFNVLQRNTM